MSLITPAWPAPPSVGAAMSTRLGGLDQPPFNSQNPRVMLLRQVHGRVVADFDALDLNNPAMEAPEADACVTTRLGVACTVLVADCLPVLFTDRQGRAVAAAHAGWRGLAGGVLEATLASLCRAAACEPSEVLAWLGPCIGPSAFEVGADVLEAFGVTAERAGPRFAYAPREDGSPRWRADLPGLAQDRLQSLGMVSVTPSGLCTVADPLRFFSFRRDGRTGRMAASIWRRL